MKIRRFALVGFVVALLVVTAAIPALAKGAPSKATGEVWAMAGATEVYLNFNAHGTEPAKGEVYYSNDQGGWFSGTVSCYYQEDNEAAFGGMVTDGTYAKPYFLIEVQDNGEGAKAADPDALRVRLFSDMPDCEISGSFPGIRYEGNLKVH